MEKGGVSKGGGPEGWGARRVGGPEGWGGPTQKKWGPRRVRARKVEGPKGGGARRVGALKGGGSNGGGAEGWGTQNFALFFPSPAAKFVSFLPSLGVFSWNFGGV